MLGRGWRPGSSTAWTHLHDGLREVACAPVTEARLHGGADEALVSSGVLGIVRGLQGVRKGEVRRGRSSLTVPPSSHAWGSSWMGSEVVDSRARLPGMPLCVPLTWAPW